MKYYVFLCGQFVKGRISDDTQLFLWTLNCTHMSLFPAATTDLLNLNNSAKLLSYEFTQGQGYRS